MKLDDFLYPSYFYPYFRQNKSLSIITPFPDSSIYSNLYSFVNYDNTLWISETSIKEFDEIFKENKAIEKTLKKIDHWQTIHCSLDKHNYLLSINNPHINFYIRFYPWDYIILDLLSTTSLYTNKLMKKLISEISKLESRLILLLPGKEYLKKNKLDSNVIFHHYQEKNDIELNLSLCSSNSEKVAKVQTIAQKGKGIIYLHKKEMAEFLESYLKHKNIKAKHLPPNNKFNSNKYFLDCFSQENHFDSIDVIITTNLDLYIKPAPNWIILFNDYMNNSKILKKIYQNTQSITQIYLLKSYDDEIIRNQILEDMIPRPKSINIVYHQLLKSISYNQFRFINLNIFYKSLRLPEVTVDNCISFLEDQKLLKRISAIPDKVYIIPGYKFNKNKLEHHQLDFLTQAFYKKETSLINYCLENAINPLSFSKSILSLSDKGFIQIITLQTLLALSIRGSIYPKAKYDNQFINKSFDLKELMQHYQSITNFIPTKNETPPSDHSQSLNLIKWIHFTILQAVSELDYPIGKHLLADTLTGSRSKKILKLDLSSLISYNALDFIKKRSLLVFIENMILKQLLSTRSSDGHYPGKVLYLTSKGRQFINDYSFLKKKIWLEHQKVFTNKKQGIYSDLKRHFNNKIKDSLLRYIALYKIKTLDELRLLKGIKDSECLELLNLLQSLYKDNLTTTSNKAEQIHEIEKFYDETYFPAIQDEDIYFLSNYSDVLNPKKRFSRAGLAIHRYKYKNSKEIPEWLINKIFELIATAPNLNNLDFIITIPGHARYPSITNKIALRISEACSISFLENYIIKLQQNKEQKILENIIDKEKNVRGKFDVSPEPSIKNKVILLLDDIYDSGLTIDECKQILYKAGANKVYALCCTKTNYRY